MTAAATSEFSAASGTTPHWLDQVTLEETARRAFLETTLEEVHNHNGFLNWLYLNISNEDKPQTLETAAQRIDNRKIIDLMREKLFGQRNTLPEFLKSGISLDLRDQKTGQTLLMTECSRPRGTSARQEEDRAQRVNNLITCHGAQTNPRLQDHNGETVSTLAAKNTRVEMLGVLAFFKDGTLRNAKGESPLSLLLDELFSPNFQNSPRTPNTRPLDNCLSRLINAHDFAGMTEENSEPFQHMSSALRTLSQDSFLYNNRDYGFMYLSALFLFAKRNDQYQKSKIAQLEAQLAAAAEEKLGRTEVPALLRPSQP